MAHVDDRDLERQWIEEHGPGEEAEWDIAYAAIAEEFAGEIAEDECALAADELVLPGVSDFWVREGNGSDVVVDVSFRLKPHEAVALVRGTVTRSRVPVPTVTVRARSPFVLVITVVLCARPVVVASR